MVELKPVVMASAIVPSHLLASLHMHGTCVLQLEGKESEGVHEAAFCLPTWSVFGLEDLASEMKEILLGWMLRMQVTKSGLRLGYCSLPSAENSGPYKV